MTEHEDVVTARVFAPLWSNAGAVGPGSWRAERAMCWVRVVAVIFGMSTVTFNRHAITGTLKWVALGVMASYGLVSLVTVLRFRDGPPRAWDVKRVITSTLASDAVLIIGLTAILAGAPRERAWVLPVLLPLVGGLKLGPRGAVLGVLGMVVAEGLGGVARTQIHGLSVDVETQISFVGIGAIGGALAGWVARMAATERSRAEAAGRHLDALNQVVLAGLGGGEDEVLPRMAAVLRDRLQPDGLVVALRDDDGELVFSATTGIEGDLGEPVPLDPDGPARSILDGGPALLLRPQQLGNVSLCVPDASSALMAPIRVKEQIAGILVIVSIDDDLDDQDLSLTVQIAGQMGLVLDAARSFDHEAKLVDRYRQLDVMRNDFVSLTSHELRTPMTAIVGIAETMVHRDIADAETRRSLASAIVRQGRRLERLVEDLRTVSVFDAGGLKFEPRTSKLVDIVRAPIEAVAPHPVVVDGDPDLAVFCDPDRAVQILANLIDNGIQHGNGTVTLRWRDAGRLATVEVSDDGPGVDEARRDRIFERFETSADMLSHHRGTGLGLPIARDLARAMGGDLVLCPDTDVGGACFRVTLPLAPSGRTLDPLPQSGRRPAEL